MNLPLTPIKFHLESERAGRGVCGADSANESVNFVFDDYYTELITEWLKVRPGGGFVYPLDRYPIHICKECDENSEWSDAETEEFI